MNDIKAIKNEKDYRGALKLVEELMAGDPDPESENGEKLSVLATLVADYESKTFPLVFPTPIEAIKFKMDQLNLTPANLIPFIGSRSRVSEILSGKRRLTLEMIRSLEKGLKIPAKVLIQEPEKETNSLFTSWNQNLLKQMQKRGYFSNEKTRGTISLENIRKFFEDIDVAPQFAGMLRQSSYRSAPTTSKQALAAWTVRVLKKARNLKTTKKYSRGAVDLAFMHNLTKISLEENGPLIVQKYLRDHGIILVIEPHLLKTRLDGAVILDDKSNPVIGLTLRHDRLDNFWFTLMHELAHIALHYDQEISMFYDELDEIKGFSINEVEKEADKLASEALVSSDVWEVSPAKRIPSSMAANSLAKKLGIHVAVVAGKIRHEGGKYYYLNNIVGPAKVRQYFPDVTWE